MRMLLVEDEALVSHALRLMLRQQIPDADILCCETGAEAIRFVTATGFDLILLDWKLKVGPTGVELLQSVCTLRPSARILVVSGEGSAARVRLAISQGAAGFVSKDSSPDLLRAAISIVMAGGTYLPPDVPAVPDPSSYGSGGIGDSSDLRSAFPRLTQRQRDTIERLVRGETNKQIARDLGISDNTVKNHLAAIFRELDVRNRTEVVFALARSGVRLQ